MQSLPGQYWTRCRWPALLLLACLLSACGPGGAARDEAGHNAAPVESGPPGAATGQPERQQPAPVPAFTLPWPEELTPRGMIGRSASAGEIIVAGDEYFAKADNAAADTLNHELRLLAGAKEMSWGIYAFGGVAQDDAPFGLSVELAGTLPGRYYLGIADYARQVWRWTAVDTPGGLDYISLPQAWQPVSPDSIVFAAVVAWDNESASLASLTLLRNVDAPPPVDLSASDGSSGSTIDLRWDDPADSFPGLVYDGVQLERAYSPEGPYNPLALVPVGETSYADIHDGSGNVLPYNTPVYYRASTVVEGTPGPAGALDSGYRLLADVAGFSATTELPDRIELGWDGVPGADMYRVEYRADGGGEPTDWTELTLTAGTFFTHTAASPPGGFCAEKQPYAYRIQAQYLGDTSLGYAEALGLHDGAPVGVVIATPQAAYPAQPVTLDGSGSYDSGGGAISYFRLDGNGDGTYEDGGPVGQWDYAYGRFGTYQATMEVTDDEGDTATGSTTVDIPGWVHTWGSSDYEVGCTLAVDSEGNIFVCGNYQPGSASYFMLAKYSPGGTRLWHHFWSFRGSNVNILEQAALDDQGNLYVCGTVATSFEYDTLVIKVLPDGTLAWAKTWDGSGAELAAGIAVDGAGHVLVCGITNGFDTNYETLLLLYSASGALTWSKTYGVSGTLREDATCVAISPSGWDKLYVGMNLTDAPDAGTGLLVLDSSANLLLQRYWWPGLDFVGLNSLAVDDSGAVYMCGMAMAGSTPDALLLKADAAGNYVWQKTWNSNPADPLGDDWQGLALDSGLLHLVGSSVNDASTNNDLTWVTINASGALLSQRMWGRDGQPDQGFGIVLGGDGALHVAGLAQDIAGLWYSCSGELNDLPGTVTTPGGGVTDVSGTAATPSCTELDITPIVDDAGGGVFDMLLIKLGPLN